jgi:hypothetical protein
MTIHGLMEIMNLESKASCVTCSPCAGVVLYKQGTTDAVGVGQSMTRMVISGSVAASFACLIALLQDLGVIVGQGPWDTIVWVTWMVVSYIWFYNT